MLLTISVVSLLFHTLLEMVLAQTTTTGTTLSTAPGGATTTVVVVVNGTTIVGGAATLASGPSALTTPTTPSVTTVPGAPPVPAGGLTATTSASTTVAGALTAAGASTTVTPPAVTTATAATAIAPGSTTAPGTGPTGATVAGATTLSAASTALGGSTVVAGSTTVTTPAAGAATGPGSTTAVSTGTTVPGATTVSVLTTVTSPGATTPPGVSAAVSVVPSSTLAPGATTLLTSLPQGVITTPLAPANGISATTAAQQITPALTTLPNPQQTLLPVTQNPAAPQGPVQVPSGVGGVGSIGAGQFPNPQVLQPGGPTFPSVGINQTPTLNAPNTVASLGPNWQNTPSNQFPPTSGTANNGLPQTAQPSFTPNQPANLIPNGNPQNFPNVQGGAQPGTFSSNFPQFVNTSSGQLPSTLPAGNQNQFPNQPGSNQFTAGNQITASPFQQGSFQPAVNQAPGNFQPNFPQSNIGQPGTFQQPGTFAPGFGPNTGGFTNSGFANQNFAPSAQQPNPSGAPNVQQPVPNGAAQILTNANQGFVSNPNGQPNQFPNTGVQTPSGQPQTPVNTAQTGQTQFPGNQLVGQPSGAGNNVANTWNPTNPFGVSGPAVPNNVVGAPQAPLGTATQQPQFFGGSPGAVTQLVPNNLPSGPGLTGNIPVNAQPGLQVTNFPVTTSAPVGGFSQAPWFGPPTVPTNLMSPSLQQPVPTQSGFGQVAPALNPNQNPSLNNGQPGVQQQNSPSTAVWQSTLQPGTFGGNTQNFASPGVPGTFVPPQPGNQSPVLSTTLSSGTFGQPAVPGPNNPILHPANVQVPQSGNQPAPPANINIAAGRVPTNVLGPNGVPLTPGTNLFQSAMELANGASGNAPGLNPGFPGQPQTAGTNTGGAVQPTNNSGLGTTTRPSINIDININLGGTTTRPGGAGAVTAVPEVVAPQIFTVTPAPPAPLGLPPINPANPGSLNPNFPVIAGNMPAATGETRPPSPNATPTGYSSGNGTQVLCFAVPAELTAKLLYLLAGIGIPAPIPVPTAQPAAAPATAPPFLVQPPQPVVSVQQPTAPPVVLPGNAPAPNGPNSSNISPAIPAPAPVITHNFNFEVPIPTAAPTPSGTGRNENFATLGPFGSGSYGGFQTAVPLAPAGPAISVQGGVMAPAVQPNQNPYPVLQPPQTLSEASANMPAGMIPYYTFAPAPSGRAAEMVTVPPVIQNGTAGQSAFNLANYPIAVRPLSAYAASPPAHIQLLPQSGYNIAIPALSGTGSNTQPVLVRPVALSVLAPANRAASSVRASEISGRSLAAPSASENIVSASELAPSSKNPAPKDLCAEDAVPDAITTTPDGLVHVFIGQTDFRFRFPSDWNTTITSVEPSVLQTVWPGVGDIQRIAGATTRSDGTSFLFSNEKYWKFDSNYRMAADSPRILHVGFPGIKHLDSVFQDPNFTGDMNFVQGNSFVSYNHRRFPPYKNPTGLQIRSGGQIISADKVDAAFTDGGNVVLVMGKPSMLYRLSPADSTGTMDVLLGYPRLFRSWFNC